MGRQYFLLPILVSLMVLGACSSNKEEAAINAIDEALYHLSQKVPECQKAIDVLEDIKDQSNNPRYVQVYASAYACRGGFSELTLFDEIDVIDASNLLTSLAKLSTSPQTEAESDDFNDLQQAIDIVLYAGGRSTPSAVAMQSKFGSRHGANLNMQALYMIIVQLGRYVRWYGNTGATGVKGSGTQGNTCFFDYTNGAALAVATSHGGGNACTGAAQGSPTLDYVSETTAVAQKRLCQGAMLINNLIDILENTDFPDNDSLGELSSVYAQIEPSVDALRNSSAAMATYVDNLSQEQCETLAGAGDTETQQYFAALFEGGLP